MSCMRCRRSSSRFKLDKYLLSAPPPPPKSPMISYSTHTHTCRVRIKYNNITDKKALTFVFNVEVEADINEAESDVVAWLLVALFETQLLFAIELRSLSKSKKHMLRSSKRRKVISSRLLQISAIVISSLISFFLKISLLLSFKYICFFFCNTISYV